MSNHLNIKEVIHFQVTLIMVSICPAIWRMEYPRVRPRHPPMLERRVIRSIVGLLLVTRTEGSNVIFTPFSYSICRIILDSISIVLQGTLHSFKRKFTWIYYDEFELVFNQDSLIVLAYCTFSGINIWPWKSKKKQIMQKTQK